MKILLIGASSYLGARLYIDLKKTNEVIGTYSTNKLSKDFIFLDITNPSDVQKIIAENKPDIVVHVANNASASWCEENPQKATLLNQKSSEYLVDAVNAVSSKIIYISSLSANDSATLYGRMKLVAEKNISYSRNGYSILRPSLILGYSPNTTNDRPFNRILKNLDDGTEALYDTSWKFQPTYIGHISEVLLSMVNKGIWNETIPISCPDLVSRFDIARDILSAFAKKVSPIDKKDKGLVLSDDQSQLRRFHLPVYLYPEILKKIIYEIKNRKEFTL